MRRVPLDFPAGLDLPAGLDSASVSGRDEFALRLVRSLPRLRRHALRRAGPGRADDVVQETLVRALQSAATYDGGRALWPWLRSIADSVAARLHEREARAPEATDDIDATAGAGPTIPDDTREEAALLLDRLHGHERDALERHYLGGESVASIAAATGAAIGTVKARLSRGRRRLLLLFGATAGALAAVFALLPRGAADGSGAGPREPRIFHASFVIEHLTPAAPQFARTVVVPQSTNGWRIEGARLFAEPVDTADIETGRLEPR